MNRKNFLRTAGVATAVAGLTGVSIPGIAGKLISAEYDKYGGWTGKKFKATGFFRAEKDDRWWVVSPEGNAFLSFGINHIQRQYFNLDYHRKEMQKMLGVKDLSSDNPEYLLALRKWYLSTCQDYGFNTAGVHTDRSIINTPKPGIAYMQPILFVDIPHWKDDIKDENFKDIFSDEFARECDKMARDIALPKKDDPYLFAYSMTDCPLFTEQDIHERTDTIGGPRRKARIGWPRRLRNLGAEAAGKKAYVNTMQNIYEGRISKFNQTYDTQFNSFDELASAKNWRTFSDLSNGNETRDNIEILKICVDKYYKVGRDSIRKYDENHMFLGDKINANTDAMDTLVSVTEKYTDIVMYQMYGKYEVQEPGLNRWAKKTDKAFLNGDSAFTMITKDMLRPFGPVADNIQQRAEWTKEFLEKAFSRPDFVGYHYCGLIDITMKDPERWDRQHSGLIDQYGKPYEELRTCIKNFTNNMYSIAIKG
ncbi:MAG: twin-arginine translocation signal domain-containing protein [Bacteroidales bacterium]